MARRSEAASDGRGELEKLLVELNLTTLARTLAEVLRAAESGSMSFSEFLRLALERERAARWERKVQRRLRWSRLGPCEGLEGFDWGARPQLSAQAVRELASCRFVEERRNVILVGRSSLGKTRIAKALGQAAALKGYSVYYVTLTKMLEDLHAAKADGTSRKAFRRVEQPSILVVDDAGLSPLSIEQGNMLFRVIAARYRTRSTIWAANLPFKLWGEFLPSVPQAVAIADRLLHDATVLRFTGKSFREPREILGAPLDDE